MSGGIAVVELRVHGVSGSPPEAVLSCPKELLVQVRGDRDAAFFRRVEWVEDAAAGPAKDGPRRLMEAYWWGGLTSRKASRALWLLLLPFSLINLAHWMLLPAVHPRAARLVVATLRLLALSFTMTFLMASAVAVLDVAVWQCGAVESCSSGWGPLAYLTGRSAGCRLAAGGLVLVVMILLLWLRGREESGGQVPKDKLVPDAAVQSGAGSPLANDGFWCRDPSVPLMRACHVTAWASGLAALLAAVPLRIGTEGALRFLYLVLLCLGVAMLVVSVAATGWTRATGRGGDQSDFAAAWLPVLRTAALVVLGVTWFAVAAWPGDVPPGRPFLPVLHLAIYVLFGVQALLFAVVFVGMAVAIGGRVATAGRVATDAALGGYAGLFVALLGWLVGGGFSVGIGILTAQILGTAVYSVDDAGKAPGNATPLIVPQAYVWAALAGTILAVALGVAAGLMWRKAVRDTAAFVDVAPDADPPESGLPKDTRRRIARARALAGLPDVGAKVLAALVALAVVIIIVATPVLVFWPAARHWVDGKFGHGPVVVTVPVMFVVVLVGLVAWSLRNRQVRRMVAILWDVITFWPRANHPLTPPSYGGRTVYDLRMRMSELTKPVAGRENKDKVVLVAHSQGTIIAAATLLQCTDDYEQYPLLTFGSPLRRLYARYFPAYFGGDTLATVVPFPADGRRRWINLWARTDPIGGWVFDDSVLFVAGPEQIAPEEALQSVDVRILDVPQVDPDHGDFDIDVDGPVCGHSGFWCRPEYYTAMGLLQSLVLPKGTAIDPSGTAPPTVEAL
ncbi:hypothetical protein JDV09_02335 [Mycobacterium sp. Y57]|uniref:hypothetical protein n=1 Tax=Mycolicibacterium xanthum TaxID=2796469 RepID=UPI001C8427C7|nr:hypothetical protein [Mycolicibacterium xanthum]MBX7430955.1 hypothetical protein [Mycolicibacterium xanthum]